VSYKRQELLTLREHLSSPPVFSAVRVAHLFSFLCCVFYFVCLRPVPIVANFSGLSILDCPFLIRTSQHRTKNVETHNRIKYTTRTPLRFSKWKSLNKNFILHYSIIVKSKMKTGWLVLIVYLQPSMLVIKNYSL
jgi:hypothetical protein